MVAAMAASLFQTLMNVTNWSLQGGIALTTALLEGIAVGMSPIFSDYFYEIFS